MSNHETIIQSEVCFFQALPIKKLPNQKKLPTKKIFPKNPFVCPKEGITPIHSYTFRMGLELSIPIDWEGSGFLSNSP